MKRSCLAMTFSTSILMLAGCAQSFSTFSASHNETASAQTVDPHLSFQRAKQLAWDAAVLAQDPPHPVERWQEARLKWRQAMRLLEAIPENSSIFSEAQKKLVTYRTKAEAIHQRLTVETMATDNFEQAQKVAWQAAILVQEPPLPLPVWQQSLERWNRAARLMGAIPPQTSVSAEAQTKLKTYRQNYQAIAQRIQSEKTVLDTLNQFSSLVTRINSLQTKALTGQTEDPIGITFEDYQTVVRSLRSLSAELNTIPAAPTNPAVAEMRTAIADYEFALSIWQTYEQHKAANADWLQNSDFFNRLVPVALIDGDRLLNRYDVKVFPGLRQAKVPLKSTIWAIWEKADQHARASQQKIARVQ